MSPDEVPEIYLSELLPTWTSLSFSMTILLLELEHLYLWTSVIPVFGRKLVI
jgi:hypothetical protein